MIGNKSIFLHKRGEKECVTLLERDNESGKLRFVKSTTKNVRETFKAWRNQAIEEEAERQHALEEKVSLRNPLYTILSDWDYDNTRDVAIVEYERGMYSLKIMREHYVGGHYAQNLIRKSFVREYTPGTLSRVNALLRAEITMYGAKQPKGMTI